MKKIFLLIGLFLLPFFAFAQEIIVSEQAAVNSGKSLYNIDTAKKFKRIKQIIKDGERCLQLPLKINSKKGGYSCIYKIEEIKNDLESENLDAFLRDANNEIVLSAVAWYVIYNSQTIYHDNFELFVTLGINYIEAAVRTEEERYIEEALNHRQISYSHWETYKSFGIMSAKEYIRTKQVQTTRQEIESIKAKLENEKSLVDNFKKEMRKFKRQIHRENRKAFSDRINKTMQNFLDKLENQSYIRPSDTYMRWVKSRSQKP